MGRRGGIAFLLGVFMLGIPARAQERGGRDKDFADRSIAFAFKLHEAVGAGAKGKNVFVSPTSILVALGMAASGARGETRDEMVRALGLDGWSREDVDAQIGGLIERLGVADPKVKLDIANSFWGGKGAAWEQDYVNTLQKLYRSVPESVDFSSSATADRIDQWVTEKTRGKITSIVERPIPEGTVLFLINAVYFKGEWTTAFDKRETMNRAFHPAEGKPVVVPFMSRKGDYSYLQTPEFRAVRIPYGEKGRMGFYVVLPTGTTSGPGLERRLTAAHWKAWKDRNGSGFARARGTVVIPRFKTEFEAELIPTLRTLGMQKAFGKGADFTGMSPAGKSIVINSVKHKTFVQVNEEGTEAAAVTSVRAGITSAPPPPFEFVADRPFFCAIVDDETDTLLFTGSIANPQ